MVHIQLYQFASAFALKMGYFPESSAAVSMV